MQASDSFWAVLLLRGFDGPFASDNDPSDPFVAAGQPTNESGTLGMTTGWPEIGGLAQPVCSVLDETIRDRKEEANWTQGVDTIVQHVLAHEIICHALDWGHECASLCAPDYYEGPTNASLSVDHIAALRRLIRPRVEPGPVACKEGVDR
jgi:hypothetical protein